MKQQLWLYQRKHNTKIDSEWDSKNYSKCNLQKGELPK